MKQFINCGQSILLFFLFFSACGTPLNDYNPKNEKEKEIKIILVQFTEYRNNFDVKNMAKYLADNCIISYYGKNLTKTSFLSVMKRSDLESRGKFKFENPKFKIVDEIAQVSIKFMQGITSFAVNFKLVHENSEWKISEWNENFH
jgi:hypothetical protein